MVTSLYLAMTFGEAVEAVRRNAAESIVKFMQTLGLSQDSYYRWKRGENLPTTNTLDLLRKHYGVELIINRDTGETEIKQLFDPAEMEIQSVSEAVTESPGSKQTGKKEPFYYDFSGIPGTARDAYEELEFYGGKPEWMDLPDSERTWYEAMFSLMEIEIDSANSARDHRINEAVATFRRAIRQRMLEQK